jgi:hypothetical protein
MSEQSAEGPHPPSPTRDRLIDVLERNRALLIGVYVLALAAFLLLVSLTNFDTIPEVFHGLLRAARGEPDPWRYFRGLDKDPAFLKSSAIRAATIAVYVLLLAGLLYGPGKVLLARQPGWNWRTLFTIGAVTLMTALLTAGALGLLQSIEITAYHDVHWLNIPSDAASIWPVLLGAWVFWLAVALVAWRGRDPSRLIPRLINGVLATSWLEFSLALPIDLATRNQAKECPCATGSWLTLLMAFPVLLWSIGPAWYLLYLRERDLAGASPGRARMILLRKSAVAPAKEARVEGHVSTARTLSLAVVVLGFVGLQIGLFNNQRGQLFNEARSLVVVSWLKQKFGDDAALKAQLPKPDGKLEVDAGFGVLTIGASSGVRFGADADTTETPPGSAPGRSTFTAEVIEGRVTRESPGSGAPGKPTVAVATNHWEVGGFSLDDPYYANRLEKIATDLDISLSTDVGGGWETSPEKLIRVIREKLYNRRVKVPGADFGDFAVLPAAWLIVLLCIAALVALRNAVLHVFRGADAGLSEPWLILDAETPLERIVAIAWLAGIFCSGWVATFGLVLTVMDALQSAAVRPGALVVGAAYVAFGVLLVAATWPAVAAVLDLIRLREIRRDAYRALVAGDTASG